MELHVEPREEDIQGFPLAQVVKKPPAVQETSLQPLGREGPLEKGMAIYPSIVAWRTPWTEESGGLQSMRFRSRTRRTH